MVARCVTDFCEDCHVRFNGPAPEVARDLAAHRAGRHPDQFLLEAQREVDALTPACPPIAPQMGRGFVRNQMGEWPDPPELPEPAVDIFEWIVK